MFEKKSLHFAPLQGVTDAAYRHFHALVYGGEQIYYTPFIRLDKDSIRPKDYKDFTSELNQNTHLIPQIIFRNAYELETLVALLKKQGIKEMNLNMGCPFPLQTGHGRGAAAISNSTLAQEIVRIVEDNPGISFSVKMRLGLKNPDEWKNLIPYLNQSRFKEVTVHPRVAKQQYKGDIFYDEFARLLDVSKNPVVYNGDIKSIEDIEIISERFPNIAGVMVGRGIIGRPSLFNEYLKGEEIPEFERHEKMLEFHRLLFNHYSSVLCGDSQIISKIQPFWEYSEEEIGRKAWKAIKKATTLAKYQTAVAMI